MKHRNTLLVLAVALAAACGDDGSNVVGVRPNTSSDSGTPVNTSDGGTPTDAAQPDSPITPPPVDAGVPDAPLPPADNGPSPCERPICARQTITLSTGFHAAEVGITCTMTRTGLTFPIEPYSLRGEALCTGQMSTCTANTTWQVIDSEGVSQRIPALFESNRDMSGMTCSTRARITIRNAMTGEVLATGTSDAL